MSHLNLRFPPEDVMDKVFRKWCEEFRRKNLHLVPKFAGEDNGFHQLPGSTAASTENNRGSATATKERGISDSSPAKPLSLWARAWLKVAKGIIR